MFCMMPIVKVTPMWGPPGLAFLHDDEQFCRGCRRLTAHYNSYVGAGPVYSVCGTCSHRFDPSTIRRRSAYDLRRFRRARVHRS